MELKIKGNVNYTATIVEIKNIISLEGCDNICGTTIMGNHVIVSKDAKIGDIGIFFPIECSISSEFLKVNNLYRDKILNIDQIKAGFFELNGRVRCVKLRGNKSEGLFMPLYSLDFVHAIALEISSLRDKIGISFDTINDILICEKYIIPNKNYGSGIGAKKGKKPRVSKIVSDQFHFHIDTEQLKRNMNKIHPYSLIQISVKKHGTSSISSKILCKKKLNIFYKFLKKIGIPIELTEYNNVYASRKVIKNQFAINKFDDIKWLLQDCFDVIKKFKFKKAILKFKNEIKIIFNKKATHFYNEDIWKKANDQLLEFLDEGMTIYYEILGYLSDNSYIQKDYDYFCEPGKFQIYIYRLTYTNPSGKIFELSAQQLQQWCIKRGLTPVHELYYGYAKDLYKNLNYDNIVDEDLTTWRDQFLEKLANDKSFYMEQNCPYNKNQVPFEGLVLRVEGIDIESYKIKCFNFLSRETKLLDKNESNIEDNQEVSE